ncbi:HD domain-containing protein [Desulfothermus okinawensis JCM 13304]
MENTMDRDFILKRIADLLFEVGMLKKTPRTGYQFLGSGSESVAEHSYRTTIIGLILGIKEGLDWKKIVLMCLFHDLHEARTGDFNYVYRRYNKAKEDKAILDALKDTPLEDLILPLLKELEDVDSKEAEIAHDADQIDLILNLKEQMDLGNPYAETWLKYALERLRTDAGRELAEKILETDHTDWWFKGVDTNWWATKNGKK